MSAILATSDEPFRHRVAERLAEVGYGELTVAELPATLTALLRETQKTLVIVGGTWPAPQPFLRVAVNAGALPLVLLESHALEAEVEAFAMGARATLQSDIPGSSLVAALAAVDAGLIVLEPSARALLVSANTRLPSANPDRLAENGFSDRIGSPAHQVDGPVSARWSDGPASARNVEGPTSARMSDGPTSARNVDGPTFARRSDGPASALPTANVPRKGRPLTSRERQILSLVAAGTSNKGIARTLSVSANTVKFHLAAVFDKLNAGTRAEAVAEAIRRGELSL